MAERRDGVFLGDGPGGLLLLFERGRRPGRVQIQAAIGRIARTFVSHDPVADGVAQQDSNGVGGSYDDEVANWLELLRDGLTFDCLGLSEGPGLTVPAEMKPMGSSVDLATLMVEAAGLFAGPHLAGGEATLPVVRTQMALAADLVDELPGCLALCWTPAAVAVGAPLFAKLVGDWLNGGAFPALALVRFEDDFAGGIRSDGLNFFIGQELVIGPDLAPDRVAATRIAVHLIHELVAIGKVRTEFETARRDGPALRVAPSSDGTRLFVRQV